MGLAAEANKDAPDLRLVAGLAVAGGGSAGGLSRQGRQRDGGPVMDFWFSLSVASCWYLLRCWWGEGGRCVGAMVASLLWLAEGWRTLASVLVWWSVAGGSAAASRFRRREQAGLEVVASLGAGPRLACHSDRWARCVLLLEVFKASWRRSVFNLRFGGRLSFPSRCLGAGDDGRLRSGDAVSSEDFFGILSSFRVLSALCTVMYVLRDLSVLCTYFVPGLSLI